MAIIHVDNTEFEVNGADNLLHACLSLGLDIPYFCWHPALGSVGACRQCAVKQYSNAEDKKGRIVMSCMTPATDNSWISINDQEAKAFRASVVEWLMANHPHDCPVCEEGGHCHLQDMTVMTGHNTRRYRFSKRTHQNQDLGPFINHEMNRCIACYRCVRYYNDYAGGTDLGVFGAHDNLYFGRVADGTLESEFSGNLTEVCPTGVFTDKTHSEHYTRKWDMQFAPSICHGCAVGCNISPGERYGEIRRIENRFNGAINHYFLCDRGRFGYGYVNRLDRPRQPEMLLSKMTLGIDAALDQAAALLRDTPVIGIGSPRASLESNFALRTLVGPEHFYSGIARTELGVTRLAAKVLRTGPLPTPSLRAIEEHDAVLILGEDLTQTAARVALAVRQAVRGKARDNASEIGIQEWHQAAVQNLGQQALYPLFSAHTHATKLDELANECIQAQPEDLARLGFAIAHAVDPQAPKVSGLDPQAQRMAEKIAQTLLQAKRPLIISGTSLGSAALVEAAANIGQALYQQQKNASLSLVVPEANSLGMALLLEDDTSDRSLEAALEAFMQGPKKALFVLENDLYRRVDAASVNAALDQAKVIIVADHQHTPTMARAHLALPAASFAEGDGTLVSMEGRAQRFFQVFDPGYYNSQSLIREGWRWIRAIDCTLHDLPMDWLELDQVTAACAEAFPQLALIVTAAPQASFRIKGLKLARAPHRYSGRTAMRAHISMHEPRQPQDADSAFAFSMEGYAGSQEERQQIPFAWSPGWNSPQAWNKFQDEVGGHLRAGDPGARLIEPAATTATWFAPNLPAKQHPDEWTVVPLYHLFGSEETSAASAPIQERSPKAYLALNPKDAQRLTAQAGTLLHLKIAEQHLSLPLQLDASLIEGMVGLPSGIAGIPPALNGLRAEITKEARA